MYEEIRPLQEKQLAILKELKRVCELNELVYFISFGTLIGAVRHQGFIPWDDDIDVCMFYDDYKKLEDACRKDLNADFFLQSAESDPQSHTTFKRLRMNSTTLLVSEFIDRDMNHGIPIDIYPMYYLADDLAERKKQIRAALMYLLLSSGAVPANHGGLIKFAAGILLKFYRGKRRQKKIDKCLNIMTKYKNTENVGMLFGNPETCKKVYPAKFFERTTKLRFEDDCFAAPVDYDGFLKIEYGDYMQLPPEEEQGVKLEHIVKIDTENPYTSYKGILYCIHAK